jgi:UDP-N-acetylglucosamine 1-carboxyvinyltransferase
LTRIVIKGGKKLYGEIEISGAKNAAVAILPATLMVDGVCRIENIPQISDVSTLLTNMTHMGAQVRSVNRTTMEISCENLSYGEGDSELMRRIRASYYFVGAMLGRFGRAKVAMPGGCDFGVRPIDQHIKGLSAMGAEIEVDGGYICAETKNGRLHGANIYLDVVSVGATINIMLAAARAEGKTVIENAAREPHIVDLANFLNAMGADIRGAGTSVIRIMGVDRLAGGSYSIIPDQIEAGTYLAAVTAAGGEVLIKNVIPKHLLSITAKLEEMGAETEDRGDAVLIRRNRPLRHVNIKTMPYPGFPTDMQPQAVACLCCAEGTSIVTEDVWDNRFKYVGELSRMGAKITVDGKNAVIEGVPALSGATVKACDLRAGAALVIAGLCTEGVTRVEDIHHIERGYEDMIGKLRGVGADIAVVEDSEPESRKKSRALA